ncbi:MAG: hypothetical protein WAZ98_06255 [Cyclobacteriaceae bacterium]
MKTKVKFLLVLGIMIIAMVTSGVPFGRQGQGASKISPNLEGCYSEQDILLLMEAGHYNRVKAEEMLRWSCLYAVKPGNE